MAIPNLFLLLFPLFVVAGLPEPDPETIQQFLPTHSPPSTIPALPEQSNLQSCPLNLPSALFPGVKSACSGAGKITTSASAAATHKTRCCPVLAAWLYSAYSATALSRASDPIAAGNRTAASAAQPYKYDMPLLPDDSETCVDSLEKSLRAKGIDLPRPNETCDVVYCYCGIRLHQFSCSAAFSLDDGGKLVGGRRVRRLEKDCLSANGFSGIAGCSKCLNTLNSLNSNKKEAWNSSNHDERTTKMQDKDCQLMGLTWLLAKNRTAYIHTVSAVLRAIMLNEDENGNTDRSSRPRSCAVNSDGMPLAVDSSEIENGSSWSMMGHPRINAVFVVGFLCLLSMMIL